MRDIRIFQRVEKKYLITRDEMQKNSAHNILRGFQKNQKKLKNFDEKLSIYVQRNLLC